MHLLTHGPSQPSAEWKLSSPEVKEVKQLAPGLAPEHAQSLLALLPPGLHIPGGGSRSAQQHGCWNAPGKRCSPPRTTAFPLKQRSPRAPHGRRRSGAGRAFLATALASATGVCVLKRGCPRGVCRRKAVLLMFPITTLTVSSFLVPEPQESLVQPPNCFMLQKVGCLLTNKKKIVAFSTKSPNC